MRILSPIAILLAAGLAACANTSREATMSPPQPDSGSPLADGSNTPDAAPEASSVPDASDASASALIPPAVATNAVTLSQSTVDGSAFTSSASAVFTPMPVPTTTWCPPQTIDGCLVLDCDLTMVPDPLSNAPNAGIIALAGPTLTPLGISLTPSGPHGLYTNVNREARLFAAGELLSVTASGGDVPAFSARPSRGRSLRQAMSPSCRPRSCRSRRSASIAPRPFGCVVGR